MGALRAFRRARERVRARRAARIVPAARRVLHEVLEDRILLDGVPVAALTLPGDVLPGETFSAGIEFSNASATDVGFGPYVDMILPRNGADGAAGTDTPDGITFNGASFLGTPVAATVLTFDALGNATHPYARDNSGAPVVVSGTPGDQLVVLLLPFGSFAPGQTPAEIEVSLTLSDLADVGTPLTVQSRGGFQFGADPLDNPTVDPSTIGAFDTAATTPELFRITKTPIAPEGETATGPDFVRQWQITVDVAPGQTLTDFVISDLVPDTLQFVSIDSVSPGGGVTESTPSTTTPGGTLAIRFPSLVGGAGAADVDVTYSFYVPRLDAAGIPVLDPATGDDRTITNTAQADASWTPLDPRDAATTVSASDDAEIVAKSIAIQKTGLLIVDGGGIGPSAGDVAQFTLAFQISDFFSLGDLVLTDVLSDGLRFDASFTPLVTVADRSGTIAGPLGAGDFTVGAVTPSPGPGTQTVAFDLSSALVTLGQADGVLEGALAGPGAPGTPATTGQITFRAILQTAFVGEPAVSSGDPTLSQGDFVTNAVAMGGTIRDPAAIGSVIGSESDDSAARFDVATGALGKTIYAINGNTVVPPNPSIAAGDTVTFRLVYQLPTSDVENFRIDDFLPLPIFAAGDVTAFVPIVSAVAPAAGVAQFGGADTFFGLSGIVPTVTADVTQNRVRFDFGSFDAGTNAPSTVEILFTVPVLDVIFADALFLTNQSTAQEGNTFATVQNSNAVVQLVYSQPILAIAKGVVATSNPAGVFAPGTVGPVAFNAPGTAGSRFAGTIHSTNLASSPIDSDLSFVDGGDLVTFAIVVENTGTGINGAFDVRIADTLPTGFAVPGGGAGLNLRVVDGTGAVMTFTGDLFTTGITIDDPGPTGSPPGALDPADPTSGRNVLVVTYDLQVEDTVAASSSITNTAALANFASQEGGLDQTPVDLTDDATVTTTAPGLTKGVVATSLAQTGTSQGNPALTDLAIGETVTFEMVITVPEGVNPLVLTDDLPIAPGILSVVSATVVGTGASLSGPGIAAPAIAISDVNLVDGFDDRAVFDFGTVTNTPDGVANANDQITVRVVARVEDVAANAQGDVLRNTATLDFGTGTRSATADVEIVEPRLTVNKVASVANADAGDTVTYTVTIAHSGASRAPAFDLSITDALQANLTLVSGSVTANLGATVVVGNGGGDTTIQVDLAELALGQTLTITYQATLIATVAPNTTITNTANLGFDSLPGPGGRTQTGSDPASVAVPSPTLVKDSVASSLAQTGSSQFNGTRLDLAIGETVTFDLTITLPEGQSTLTLTDDLPTSNGILSLVSAEIVSIGSSITGSALAVGDPGVASDVNLVDGFLDRVVWSFGTVTNNADGVANAGDRIVVRVVARAENVVANAAGDNLVNNATLDFGTGSVSSARGVDIVEPRLDVQKSVAPTSGDAGDVVTYTIAVAHLPASTAPGFDLAIADLLEPNLALVAGSVTANLGATVVTGNVVGDTQVAVTLGELLLGQTLTITYQATVLNSAAAGQSLVNTADLDFDSYPGEFTPGNPGRPQSDSDTASLAITSPQLTKAVVDSDLAETGSSQGNGAITDLAIGETVTFELVITLPEGTTQVELTDDLPTANGILSFFDAQVVSTGANLSGANLGSPTITASDVNLVDGFDDRVVFDFGSVTNAPDGVANAADTIVVRVRAVVRDVPANQAGDVLTNTGTLDFGNGTTSATAQVELVAPAIDVQKSAAPATADAGDTVAYTVVVSNLAANGATAAAFDVEMSDLLGPNLLLVVGSVATSLGTVTTGNVAGDASVVVSIPTLALGQSATITYQVVLAPTVVAGSTEINTAQLAADSFPGTNPVGDDGRPQTDSDTASVAIPGAGLEKIIVATTNPETGAGQGNPAITDVAIGETVTYDLVVTVPEGTTTLLLVDNLPAATSVMEVLSATLFATGANLTLAPPTITISDSLLADGIDDLVEVQFGAVTNAPDGVTNADDQIVIRVVARVPDVAANAGGDLLTNTAILDDGLTQTSDTATVEIVEPDLQIAKTPSATGAAPGDVLTYTVLLSHGAASTSAAFDVVIDDLLTDPLLALVPGSVTTTLGTVTTGNAGGDTDVRVDVGVLPLGQSVTVTYQVQVAANAPAAVNAVNTATVDYTSDPDGDGRDDATQDAASIVTTPSLEKSAVASSIAQTSGTSLAIGETVTFELVITLPEGTSTVLVTDDLPVAPGILSFVSASVVSLGASLSGAGLGSPAITVSDANLVDGFDDRVVLDFGSVVNTPGGALAGADDQIVIRVVARVEDVAANAAGDVLTNTARLDYGGIAGSGAVTDTADVAIVEPLLDVQKTANATSVDAGDVVTYTVVVTHLPGSTAPAFGVRIADLLGAEFALVAGSVTATGGATVSFGNAPGDTAVQVDLAELPLGATLTVTYQAAVQTSVTPGATLPNTASLDWSSSPDPGGRPGTDTDDAAVTSAIPTLDKAVAATSVAQTSGANLVVGETVSFDLVITLPEGTSTITLTDDLPFGAGVLSVVSSQVLAIGANVGGSLLAVGAPGVASDAQGGDGLLDRVVFAFGTVTNAPDGIASDADQIVVRVVARVEDVPANAAGDVLTNIATLDYGAGTATDSADVAIVEPALAIDKSISDATPVPGQTVTYTVVVTHTGTSGVSAFDLAITDALDPNVALVAGSVTASLGTVTTGNGGGDTSVRVDLAELPLGQALTITYQAVVSGAAAGVAITNTAQLGFDSLPGPGGRTDGGTDAVTVTVGTPQLAKSVVDSSLGQTGTGQGDPSLTDLTIGETVTFELLVTVPDGTTPILLTDQLPIAPGVLSLVSSQVVAIGSNLTGSLLGVGAAGVASDAQGGDGLLDRVVFDFGTLTNPADSVIDTRDQIRVQVVARVVDVPANAAGDVLTNTSALDFGTGTTTATADVELVEPQLLVDKTVSRGGVAPGETVTYTVVVSHAPGSSAPAFAVAIDDALTDPWLELVPGSVTVSLGGAVVTAGNGGGDTAVGIDLAELPLGQSLVVTYDVLVPLAAPAATSLLNTAALDWSSTPTDGRPGTGTDDASITTLPNLGKSVAGTSDPNTGAGQLDPSRDDVRIGETVTFEIVITLPDGTSTLTLTDDLPFGPGVLSLVSSRVVSIGSSLTGSALAVGDAGVGADAQGGDGLLDRVTFAFGTITNTPGGGTPGADDQIVLEVVGRVEDLPANAAGTVLTNRATLTYTGPGGDRTLTDEASVEVVEPRLEIDKSGTPRTVFPGDVVTYTLVVRHGAGSSADAFDVVIADALPAGLSLVPGSVTASAGTVVGVAGGIRVELARYALGDAPIAITYRATLANVDLGANVVNTATTSWDDVPGPGGRPGEDGDTETVSTLGYSYDGVNDFHRFPRTGHRDPGHGWVDERWDRLPRLTLDPLYTGAAEPGATITLTLHGQHGAIVGQRTVVVDAGGNWAAAFPSASLRTRDDWTGGTLARLAPARVFDAPTGVVREYAPIWGWPRRDETVIGTSLEESPHAVQLEQVRAPWSAMGDTPAQRAYFTGALDASVFVHQAFEAERVFGERASAVVDAALRAGEAPEGAWNAFTLDFLAASSSPDGR